MYYYTYEIKCTEDPFKDKYYYGKHSTDNLNDNYICSSKILLNEQYINKHPNGYIKTIIAFYSSEQELNEAEKLLISKHLGKENCLNIACGGDGGDVGRWKNTTPEQRKLMNKHTSEAKKRYWANISDEDRKKYSDRMRIMRAKFPTWNKGKNISEETKKKISKSNKGKTKGLKHSEETKQKMSKAWDNMTPEARNLRIEKIRNANIGKKRSEVTKKRISESHRGISSVHKGKIGIHKGNTKKYINETELSYYINIGYTKGFK